MLSSFFGYPERFNLFDSLEREMSHALSHSVSSGGSRTFFQDTGDALVLTVEVPGVADKDVEITIEGDVLTLRAEAQSAVPEGYKLARAERSRVRLFEQLELPVRVDADKVQAALADGVLTLTLPKAAEARPRKIPVIGAKNAAVS